MSRPPTLPMVADACPELALDWHPSNDRTPDQVSIGAKYRALWRCRTKITYRGRRRACGYEWRNTIANRARAKQGCPACAGKAVSDWNNLGHNSPIHAKEWAPENDRTPYEVTTGSGYVAKWTCSTCSHKWRTTVDKRFNRLHGCPACSRRGFATDLNNLAALGDADLVRDWHACNPNSPADFRPQSSARVWWRCGNAIPLDGVTRLCGHEWRQTINRRFNGVGCPGCAGQAATDWNNLTITDPNLIPQWHRGNTLRPHEVTRGSKKRITWQCLDTDCEYIWVSTVDNRSKGKGCPACAGLVVTERNNFAVRHPKYVSQWAASNRYRPHDVTPGTDYRATWVCDNEVVVNGVAVECGHEWKTRPANRINGTDCPACMLWGTSRDEIYLAHELAHFLPVDPTTTKVRGDSGQRWKVDIAIPDLWLVVEYDGSYWHRDKATRDTRKSKDLTVAGWHVIRVREQPLDLLTSADIPCRPGQHKETAIATLQQIERITGTTISGLDSYAAHGDLVNNVAARQAATELRTNVLANRLARAAVRAS